MAISETTISIRLPREIRKALDEAAKTTRRSRAFLMKEALERHLEDIKREQSPADRQAAYGRIYALQGSGKGAKGYRTAEEIDALIREIRGDD
jgi:predicted transcriptional regulator